jgi:hypothetical protein
LKAASASLGDIDDPIIAAMNELLHFHYRKLRLLIKIVTALCLARNAAALKLSQYFLFLPWGDFPA